MKKLVIELEVLSQVLPEAQMIPLLPRKKKKKLKKKISAELLRLAEEFLSTVETND